MVIRAHNQQGSSLIIVLVGLTVLLLTTLMLDRTVQTSAIVSSNLAYKAVAQSMTDRGIAAARTAVAGLTNVEVAVSPWYWSTTQTVDSQGIPVSAEAAWATAPSLTEGGYTARYVVDRQCTGTPATDPAMQCMQETHEVTYSSKAGAPVFTMAVTSFRVTVRVDGPRNTVSYAQALIAK